MDINFLQENVHLESISYTTCQEELEHIIKRVHNFQVCSGGPSTSLYKIAQPECAVKDGAIWRHNKCPKVLDKGSVCQYCASLHQLLSRNVTRKRKGITKRVRVATATATPRSKKAILSLRRRVQVKAKRLFRRDQQILRMKNELEECSRKLSEVSDGAGLENELKKRNIPEPQVMANAFVFKFSVSINANR